VFLPDARRWLAAQVDGGLPLLTRSLEQ